MLRIFKSFVYPDDCWSLFILSSITPLKISSPSPSSDQLLIVLQQTFGPPVHVPSSVLGLICFSRDGFCACCRHCCKFLWPNSPNPIILWFLMVKHHPWGLYNLSAPSSALIPVGSDQGSFNVEVLSRDTNTAIFHFLTLSNLVFCVLCPLLHEEALLVRVEKCIIIFPNPHSTKFLET